MSRAQQEAGTADPFDPFGYWKSMREGGMEAWSKAMQEFVNSEEYASASAEWLNGYLTASEPFREAVDKAMDRALRQYHLPSTEDLTRLATQVTNIEMRLDDLDARMDEIVELLKRQDNGSRRTQGARAKEQGRE